MQETAEGQLWLCHSCLKPSLAPYRPDFKNFKAFRVLHSSPNATFALGAQPHTFYLNMVSGFLNHTFYSFTYLIIAILNPTHYPFHLLPLLFVLSSSPPPPTRTPLSVFISQCLSFRAHLSGYYMRLTLYHEGDSHISSLSTAYPYTDSVMYYRLRDHAFTQGCVLRFNYFQKRHLF